MNNFYTYALYDQSEIFAPFYIGKGCGKRMYVHEQKAKLGKLRNKHLQNKILQARSHKHAEEAKRKIGLASKNISDETRNKIRESVRKIWLLRKQKSEVTNG